MKLKRYEVNQKKTITFMRNYDPYGGLSNTSAYPMIVNGIKIKNVEALYQSMKFPKNSKIQKKIIEANSGYAAKLIAYRYSRKIRTDWDDIRIRIMYWCLKVKLAQNMEVFGNLLRCTGSKKIVEHSYRDDFWGAKLIDSEYIGNNQVGKLLMRLRKRYIENERNFYIIKPPKINKLLLYREPVEKVKR